MQRSLKSKLKRGVCQECGCETYRESCTHCRPCTRRLNPSWAGKTHTAESKRKISKARKANNARGAHAHNFKGGSWVYWVKVIKERDNNTCVACSLQSEHVIQVAHIKPIQGLKNRRTSGHPLNTPENLVCLCANCHTLYDKGLIDKQILLEHVKS